MPCGFRAVGLGRLIGMLSTVSRTILKSFRLAPSTARPIGMPFASVSRLRLVPSFARSVGLGPVFFPSKWCFRHGTVHRQPSPINSFQPVISQQAASPEFQKYSGLGPFQESAMCRRAAAEASPIQRIPLNACAEHKQNCIHGISIWNSGVMTAQRMGFSRRQQRLDLLPELVGDLPSVVGSNQSHAVEKIKSGIAAQQNCIPFFLNDRFDPTI